MRSIKFRAWDVQNKRFIKNVQNLFNDMGKYPACFADVLNDDNYIVEQYTGLKGQNGVEIYEGDVIRGETGWYGEVIWSGVGFRVCAKRLMDTTWLEYVYPEIEVVDNVHENPELLEADK